ncbi:uncharacterized transporter C460.05 [Aspergillus udagawae]|nr:uncharacterized transporter C460.05 [Aspergillus udagawae]
MPSFDQHKVEADVHSSLSSHPSADKDDSYDVYTQARGLEYPSEEAKKVLRKIDTRLIPLLVVIYMLQYLDKNSLNFASVYGLKKGTNLHGQDYAWLGSIFYFGYLIAQYPAGYALQRLPMGKVLSITTIMWGALLMTTPACHNFAGIAANRFLLGFVEAVVNPGFVLLMSMWYTAQEQPLRLEAYYCTNGIATMFGGLIGYAVGHITSGLPRWMYVFLIFGAVSVATGILSLLLLPDLPSTARFLTPRERAIAVDRVARNQQGVKNHHFKWEQVWQAARDPKTWLLFVMAVGAQVPNSALTSFTSIIVGSFGFDTLGTQYLQIPGGAVQFLALLVGGWIATKFGDKFHSRSACMIVANSICIIGSGLLVGLPATNKWGRLVALWLCYFQGLGFSMSLTVVSSNVAGYTKKQVTGALLFTGYCVGNIIGPQTFKESEAPRYRSAYIAMLVGYVVKLVSITALYVYMYSENRRRDRMSLEDSDADRGIENGMLDQTEIDNKQFRRYCPGHGIGVVLRGKMEDGSWEQGNGIANTSSTSTELIIGVSSLLTFDVYKTCFRPQTDSATLVRVSHWAVALYALLLSAFCSILNAVALSLTWVLTVIVGRAAVPVGPILLWGRMSTVATIVAPWLGFVCGIVVAPGIEGVSPGSQEDTVQPSKAVDGYEEATPAPAKDEIVEFLQDKQIEPMDPTLVRKAERLAQGRVSSLSSSP